MNKRRQLIYNSVKCLGCKKNLISRDTHDFQMCKCANKTFVDGGWDYCRYGGENLDLIQIQCVYADDDFELVRQYFQRGSRGINGKEKLRWVPLKEMDVDYILAIKSYFIEKRIEMPKWMEDLYNKELEYRKGITT